MKAELDYIESRIIKEAELTEKGLAQTRPEWLDNLLVELGKITTKALAQAAKKRFWKNTWWLGYYMFVGIQNSKKITLNLKNSTLEVVEQ